MKKTFKLSIVMLCVLMFFASCAGAPETTIPGGNVMEHLDGKPNGDGNFTLITKDGKPGIVVNKDGFFVGSVELPADTEDPDAKPVVKNSDGEELVVVPLSDEDHVLVEKVIKLVNGNPEETFKGALELTTVDPVWTGRLTKEVTVGDITFHAYYFISDSENKEFNESVVFTSNGVKHSLIFKNEASFFDGSLFYVAYR